MYTCEQLTAGKYRADATFTYLQRYNFQLLIGLSDRLDEPILTNLCGKLHSTIFY
jgi:hypothetical protein